MAEDERWTLTFRAAAGPTAPELRVRRLLKIAKGYGLYCVAGSADAEIARLRKIVEGLATRVAEQSELLARRAERNANSPNEKEIEDDGQID